MSGQFLIVGLGNPGSKYERTRHNLGFLVIDALAQKHNLSFKRGWKIDGKVAQGIIGESKVYLLKPDTYMNLSGKAVLRALQAYKIELKNILVVVDDVYVKFGSMRIRPTGGAGGHNGLKSVDSSLRTQDYPRLRMGVGPQEGDLTNGLQQALEDYVLANFTFSEQVQLSRFVDNAVSVVETWLSQGVETASQQAGSLSVNQP